MTRSGEPSRGRWVTLAGRRLRIVEAGPPGAQPLILCEHGAFGCAEDWAEVQARLAQKGLRSLAYDRAGLGLSDPGPQPRDGAAIVADSAALLQVLEEEGPLVLVGHSMGGLMVRLFAARHPGRVVGVVLVDAVPPEMWDLKHAPQILRAYGRSMEALGVGARYGLMRPVAAVFGNLIGLTGEAAVLKRRIYGSPTHARWAAAEVSQWPTTSALAARAPFDPDWPLAVITAGADRSARALKMLQEQPARASRRGYVEHVAGSNHASLLGARFADPVVRGVEHVLAEQTGA